MALPISPPYAPMEALLVDTIVPGKNGSTSPNGTDGFRCMAFQRREERRAAVEAETLEMASRTTGKR
jgi:hypothetical protein